MASNPLFMTDAELAAELTRCVSCESKPCLQACPADCSPADFIMAARGASEADMQRAAAQIMLANPLGGVCGVVCPDIFCQAACSRTTFDRAIEIPMIQAAIVARAKKTGRFLRLEETAPSAGLSARVAVVGAGPAGIGAAGVLAQMGYQVEILERRDRPGGAAALIPPHRLRPEVLQSDLALVLEHSRVTLRLNTPVDDPTALLQQGFAAVLVAGGQHDPISLGVEGEAQMLDANRYLAHPERFAASGRVAVIGGGSIACDAAVTAKLRGAVDVEMYVRRDVADMPLTPHERLLLNQHQIGIINRTRVTGMQQADDGSFTLHTRRTAPNRGADGGPKVRDLGSRDSEVPGFEIVILAVGHRPDLRAPEHPAVFKAGSAEMGAATVVEAVASGKNAALQIDAYLRKVDAPQIADPLKGRHRLPGYRRHPVSLQTEFFGRPVRSPFFLSAAPATDGYEPCKKAYQAGWAGVIMKTAFDGQHIHIPADYMHRYDADTYGNCDNVSGHSLDRVCDELHKLLREFPDRFTAASTGGPVTGDDQADARAWQSNARKLEEAGAMAVEFSLSCPQGGDGTEGSIVSQSATVSAKVVDWIMQTSRPDVPKLFKLTGAVTSIAVIVGAIKEVLDRYPGKLAGVTLANSFPTVAFRPRPDAAWDQAILFGMAGAGVAPISFLTLSSVAHLGVPVSGNGGVMDYRSAAHMLALGARNVQLCTAVMKYGFAYIDELESGLSHLLADRDIGSVAELIGRALPHPIADFDDLTPTKRVPQVDEALCTHCGNCARCNYLAVELDARGLPSFDPARCIGCSICAQKCFTGALHMRERSEQELRLIEEAHGG